ncbi:MAG TPA: DinB family protein [Longimicrobiales bacterium]
MTTKQLPDPAKVAFGDFENELNSTRTMLERVPTDQLSWRPHEKSSTLGALAQHVANLPWFVSLGVNQDEYDMAGWQPPPDATSTKQILEQFEQQAAAATAALEKLKPEMLLESWTLRMGEQVFFTLPRVAVVRTFAISHMVHHRAQLAVYLRLLNVPVPGLYGPSADER